MRPSLFSETCGNAGGAESRLFERVCWGVRGSLDVMPPTNRCRIG